MGTYSRLRDLPLEVESYELEGLEREVSKEFTRYCTLIRLQGAGHEGMGEDVTYEGLDQVAFQEEGATLPLVGSHTLDSFSRHLGELDLFPAPPVREDMRPYRRWAFESAALDLALRQAGRSLGEALEREPRPVRYVVSIRLGEPPSVDPLRRILENYPGMRFKLDPTNSWGPALIAEIGDTAPVDCVDLKGFYRGTPVDVETDPELYRAVAEAFPDAWIEDADLNAETEPVLASHRDRLTWDAPIHSVEDIEARPYPPRTINVKPSRFGSLSALCDAYDYCEERGIAVYGGGQSELSVGRGQIQYLASLFHPDTPNDVAPGEFNSPVPPAGLPASPLEPRPSATGFRWG